jgi:hypothetical protein
VGMRECQVPARRVCRLICLPRLVPCRACPLCLRLPNFAQFWIWRAALAPLQRFQVVLLPLCLCHCLCHQPHPSPRPCAPPGQPILFFTFSFPPALNSSILFPPPSLLPAAISNGTERSSQSGREPCAASAEKPDSAVEITKGPRCFPPSVCVRALDHDRPPPRLVDYFHLQQQQHH